MISYKPHSPLVRLRLWLRRLDGTDALVLIAFVFAFRNDARGFLAATALALMSAAIKRAAGPLSNSLRALTNLINASTRTLNALTQSIKDSTEHGPMSTESEPPTRKTS